MSQQIDLLDWNVILSKLATGAAVIRHHEIHGDVSSTNDLALQQSGQTENVPAVYFAERQMAGRGRRGREWFSPLSQNIYMSLSWRMPIEKMMPGGLSIAMGVLVARCLQQFGINAGLKWPNDVLVNHRKIAGILVESRMKSGEEIIIVVGVGLNYVMKQNPQAEERIQQAWTDFRTEYGGPSAVSRSELAGSMLEALICGCQQYEQSGLEDFLPEWQKLDVLQGHEVDVVENGIKHSGRMLGIERDGRLRVLHEDGEKTYHSAEISVRLRD